MIQLKESQTVEFKQIWKDEYLKTICAFSNSEGGDFYIGICDDGSVRKVQNLKEAVINALIHRDYSNTVNLQIKVYDEKLVMYNGATLSEEVPIERFDKPHQSKPFNPTIASVFYKAQVEAQVELNETEKRILILLKHKNLSSKELVEQLGLKILSGSIKNAIKHLLEVGFISYTIPNKPRSKNQKYKTVNQK